MTDTLTASFPAPAHRTPSVLRVALGADAGVTAVNAVGYLFGAAVIGPVLGAPPGLLVGLGTFLAAYAAVVGAIALRRVIAPAGAWTVVAANCAWVAASCGVLASGKLTLTDVGIAWVLLQSVAVAAFATAQFVGLRRLPSR